VLAHIETTRSTLYLGVAFSAIQVMGAALVCWARGRPNGTQTV